MYKFKNDTLRILSLTPRSKNRKVGENNQRLELLGDSIVNSIITHALYRHHPKWEEGELTQARLKLISNSFLAPVADALGLCNGYEGEKARCDLLEAYIGAIFLDGGYGEAEKELLSIIDERIKYAKPIDDNYKAMLQMYCQKVGYNLEYIVEANGPQHNIQFTAQAVLKLPNGDVRTYPKRSASSKKGAEIEAAQAAIDGINTQWKGGGQ